MDSISLNSLEVLRECTSADSIRSANSVRDPDGFGLVYMLWPDCPAYTMYLLCYCSMLLGVIPTRGRLTTT